MIGQMKGWLFLAVAIVPICLGWYEAITFEGGNAFSDTDELAFDSWDCLDNPTNARCTPIPDVNCTLDAGRDSNFSLRIDMSDGTGEVDLREAMPDVGAGDNIWVRLYIKHAPGFDWGSYNGGSSIRKGIRVTRSGGGSHIGPRGGILQYTTENQLTGTGSYLSNWSLADWYDNEWHAWEFSLQNISTDTEKAMAWMDGELILKTSFGDLHQDPDYLPFIEVRIFDTFNDAMNQGTLWMDDVFITNETPSQTDSEGNPIIGTKGEPTLLLHEDFDSQSTGLTCQHTGDAASECGVATCGSGAFTYVPDNYDGGQGYSMDINYSYLCGEYQTRSNHVWKSYVETGTGQHFIRMWFKNQGLDSGVGWANKFGRSGHTDDPNYNDAHMEWHYEKRADLNYTWYLAKGYPEPDNVGSWNNLDDDWHKLEIFYQYDNPIGACNGIVRMWVDDELLGENTSTCLNAPGYEHYNRFWFTSNAAYDANGSWRIDEIEVWDGIPEDTAIDTQVIREHVDDWRDGLMQIRELMDEIQEWKSSTGRQR